MQAQINPRKNLKCWEFFFCLGAVSPPSNRTSLIFAPGATAKIVWSFNDEIQSLSRRTWSLIFPDGRLPTVVLAILDGDDDHRILQGDSPPSHPQPPPLACLLAVVAFPDFT